MSSNKRSPSALTAERLKSEGWLVETVERWIPGANVRKDLLGFIDQLCFKDDIVIAIQSTSWTNVKARVIKITESDNIKIVRRIGWPIYVYGWRKTKNKYECKIIDLS